MWSWFSSRKFAILPATPKPFLNGAPFDSSALYINSRISGVTISRVNSSCTLKKVAQLADSGIVGVCLTASLKYLLSSVIKLAQSAGMYGKLYAIELRLYV